VRYRRSTDQVIDDVAEVNGDAAGVNLLQGAVVDKLGDLFQADLVGTLAEDKEQCVDDVGLATAIRAHDRGEALCNTTETY
jgi:hypothetical protein